MSFDFRRHAQPGHRSGSGWRRAAGFTTALVLLGLCLASPVTSVASPAVRPGAATTAAPEADSSYVGLWTDSYEQGPFDDLGAGWARATVRWSRIETADNVVDQAALERLDGELVGASGGGRRNVIAVVVWSPGWAAASRCTTTTQDERDKLAEFMTFLVNRYADAIPDGPLAGQVAGVKYWSLNNEADNTSQLYESQVELGGCYATRAGGTPTQEGRDNYALMLETVGAAIHAADPGARVVSSALSSGAFVTLPGCAGADFDTACRVDPDFLRGIVTTLKARGALGQLDVIAVNYFSSQGAIFGTPQLENWAQLGPDHVGRVAGLRQKMRDGGLTEAELKPIVVLEGSFTGELGQIDNPTTPEAAAAFSQAQRNYVVKALARAAAADVLAYYWFWLRDTVGGLGGDVPYGLVDTGGAPKPSYQAYRHFTGLIRRRDQFVRTLSFSSPKLEGYELTATDGRLVQVVWNQVDEEAIAYAPGGTILGAVGPIGEEVAPTAGAVAVGPDPRFIFYAP